MSIGISELARSIRYMREFLESRLTPELMAQISAAAQIIQNTLGDPNIQTQSREALEQLNKFLADINTTGIVKQISDLIPVIKATLDAIDPKDVSEAIKAINKLLQEAENAKMIENITEALKTIKSLGALIEVANQLVMPAAYLMYGLAGAKISITILMFIKAHLDSKKDSELQQLIDINVQQLGIQINQLRFAALHTVLSLDIARHQHGADLVLRPEVLRGESEALRILRTLPETDIEDLGLMKMAIDFSRDVFKQFYQAKLANESMAQYLDCIGENANDWDQLINFVIYRNQFILGNKDKPVLPRDELTYRGVKRLYGSKIINGMMQDLLKELRSNGGLDLYYKLANSFEATAFEFAQAMKDIVQQQLDANALIERGAGWHEETVALNNYYHGNDINQPINNATQYIASKWESASWANYQMKNQPTLTPEIVNIIRARAYVELCNETAPYLFAPYNMPREIANGLLDIPKGFYQVVCHPLKTVQNTGSALASLTTVDGWKNLGYNMGSSLCNHPTRVATGLVADSLIGVGVTKWMKPVPLPTPVNSFAIIQKGSALASTTTLAKATSAASAACQVTNITTKSSAKGEAPKNNDMTTANDAEKRTMLGQQNEKSTQSTVTSALVIISEEAFMVLTARLALTNNIVDFYGVIGDWYEGIQQNTLDAKPVSVVAKSTASISSLSRCSLFADTKPTRQEANIDLNQGIKSAGI